MSLQKPKVVFDPSDNYLSKKTKKENGSNSFKRYDSDSSSPEANPVGRPPAQKSAIREDLKRKEPKEQCSICSKYEIKSDKLLIFCVSCNYKGEQILSKHWKFIYNLFTTSAIQFVQLF